MTTLASLSLNSYINNQNASFNDNSLTDEIRYQIYEYQKIQHPKFYYTDATYYRAIKRIFEYWIEDKGGKVFMKFKINDYSYVHLYFNNYYYGLSRYHHNELKESKKLSSIEQGLQIIEQLIDFNKMFV